MGVLIPQILFKSRGLDNMVGREGRAAKVKPKSRFLLSCYNVLSTKPFKGDLIPRLK